MNTNNNKGYILITVLLLLLVLTVIGIAAIGTSTVENALSGNINLRERNVSKADAGTEISGAIIERGVRVQDTQGFTNIINPVFPATSVNYLPVEMRSSQFDPDTQDISFNVTNTETVNVDIDKMYSRWIGGTAMEFASGYEGAGKSGGSGFYTFYRVNATSTRLDAPAGNMMAQSQVGTIYRYVPK